jgi:hypothetical protein
MLGNEHDEDGLRSGFRTSNVVRKTEQAPPQKTTRWATEEDFSHEQFTPFDRRATPTHGPSQVQLVRSRVTPVSFIPAVGRRPSRAQRVAAVGEALDIGIASDDLVDPRAGRLGGNCNFLGSSTLGMIPTP